MEGLNKGPFSQKTSKVSSMNDNPLEAPRNFIKCILYLKFGIIQERLSSVEDLWKFEGLPSIYYYRKVFHLRKVCSMWKIYERLMKISRRSSVERAVDGLLFVHRDFSLHTNRGSSRDTSFYSLIETFQRGTFEIVHRDFSWSMERLQLQLVYRR